MHESEYARLEARSGEPLLFKGVKISGELRGLLFEARVEQRFCNPTDTHAEVVYTFPLPWGAVLLGVDVLLGAQRLTGTVIAKQEAQAQYEEALSVGDAAIMLERNHDHSYCLNLGNLAPQEDCVVTLRYAQLLRCEQGGARLLIPTVIAPRYGNALVDAKLQPHQTATHDVRAEHPFDLILQLHGDLALARVASPSHPISVVTRNSSSSEPVLKVALARRAALDRDFVLVIDEWQRDSLTLLAQDSVSGGMVLLASFCPRIAASTPPVIALKMLVDCSGSMAGDSINAAKRALQAIVLQLNDGDRFSLSRFGNSVEHRSRGLWLHSPATRLAAQRWVGDLQANLGGTEMEAALSSTFALAQKVSSDVLLVTDGEINAIDATIAAAQASGHRLFVVGIGSSPAEALLRRLAETTGGACDFVAPGEAVEPAVLRMFARLRSPRLNGLRLAWPEGVAAKWISPLPQSIFDGDSLTVFAELDRAPSGNLRLLGIRDSDLEAEQISIAALDSAMITEDTLPRMAMALRLQNPATGWQVGDDAQAQQLALTYQLLTDQTNFLLVHERGTAEKATDMPALYKISQMLAAGWGGMGATYAAVACASMPPDLCVGAPAPAMPMAPPSPMPRGAAMPAGGPALRKRVGMDFTNPRHMANGADYAGLTPLGLCAWISSTPTPEWPRSYADLKKLGLGVWVVDWLELACAQAHGASEQAMVAAFLYLLAQPEIHAALTNDTPLPAAYVVVRNHIQGLYVANTLPQEIDPDLVSGLITALTDMSATRWPDCIFSLGEIG